MTTATLPAAATEAASLPTVWGLDPVQLHDHFWAARGVFVVRVGEPIDITRDAELYLLTDPRTLSIFRLTPIVDRMSWVHPDVMFIRLRSKESSGYREAIETEMDGQFRRFRRMYGDVLPRLARVALTRHIDIARQWQHADYSRTAWRALRAGIHPFGRDMMSISARVYDRRAKGELHRFVQDLIQYWKNPQAILPNIREVAPHVWAWRDIQLQPGTKFVGPAWIGSGRQIDGGASVLGPTALWDDPSARPQIDRVVWSDLEPAQSLRNVSQQGVPAPRPRGTKKRLFDIAFAIAALLVTLPLYPFIMLAIWLEDGRPFFFAHRRQTLGGRDFGCLKFRSMRKNAEKIKAKLQESNQADGPQFFLKNDPRLTRVGRFLRDYNLDELPQFLNVLVGHMSVVGPRPSPNEENQFCPSWREARLSVRPGITGLWQIRRTRSPGLDFQEWIRYDLEYVQKGNWRMDLMIVAKTIRILLRG